MFLDFNNGACVDLGEIAFVGEVNVNRGGLEFYTVTLRSGIQFTVYDDHPDLMSYPQNRLVKDWKFHCKQLLSGKK